MMALLLVLLCRRCKLAATFCYGQAESAASAENVSGLENERRGNAVPVLLIIIIVGMAV